eukprot:5221903-Pleurochrysis_carterae.AAC.1
MPAGWLKHPASAAGAPPATALMTPRPLSLSTWCVSVIWRERKGSSPSKMSSPVYLKRAADTSTSPSGASAKPAGKKRS